MTKNLNAFQNFQSGFSISDALQQRNLQRDQLGLLKQEFEFKKQQEDQKLQQEQAKQAYAVEAFNNPEALKHVYARDRELGESIAKERDKFNRISHTAISDTLNAGPQQKQEAWDITRSYLNQRGIDVSDLSAEYSPEVEKQLRAKQKELRTWDDTFKAIETDRGLMNQSEKTGELTPTGYDTLQNKERKLDIAKKNEDLMTARQERQNAANSGLTPSAYKKQQEVIAEDDAKKKLALPKAQAQAEDAINLIDEVISHPGMKSMVGVKNPLSGAASTLLPFVNKPIPGSDAAGFMAKYEQLQGKNFLQAYETLKGGGQITEIEGKKATDAISAMQLSTSEKEFKAAAKDLKSVLKKGLERAGGKLPENKEEYSEEDVNYTAKKHGITPEEVKRRLKEK